MNKYQLNAAIWAMLNGNKIEESAQTVIQYGDRLKVSSAFSLTLTQESTTREFGINTDRIGHFKMWKIGKREIRFQHFWKSERETQGADEIEPVEYSIRYNKNLELIFFGQRVETEYRLGFISIFHAKFSPLYGNRKISEGWGLRIQN